MTGLVSGNCEDSGFFLVRILTSPFVKVEDISRTYKPQWACFDQWPVIDADCHAGMCPFDINRMDGDTQRRDGVT